LQLLKYAATLAANINLSQVGGFICVNLYVTSLILMITSSFSCFVYIVLTVYRVGQIKPANTVSFVVVKHDLDNFDNFWQVKYVPLYTLRSIEIKYFSPEGATEANDVLCSSILAVLLVHNFYIKTILLTNIYGKKIVCFR